jgi:hypothetical protein
VNEDFLVKLAHLCDIFEKLNAMNLSLQGRNMHLLKSMENILAFITKTKAMEDGGKRLWSRKPKVRP